MREREERRERGWAQEEILLYTAAELRYIFRDRRRRSGLREDIMDETWYGSRL